MSVVTWDAVLEMAVRLGRNAFIASLGPQGQPHLAVVWVVAPDGRFHFVSDRSAVKAKNLAADPSVAVHWQVVEDGPNEGLQLFVRGTATLVEAPEERLRLWDSGAWGDLSQWYANAQDPTLAFIRIDAVRASIVESYGSGDRRTWRR